MNISFIQMKKDGKRAAVLARCDAVPRVGDRVNVRGADSVIEGDVLYVSYEIDAPSQRQDITVEVRQQL